MRQEASSEALALGMRRVAEFVAQQARERNIGPIRVIWEPLREEDVQPNRVALRIAMGADSREVTLGREPVEDYGRGTDTAMMRAVLQELVRRLIEERRG